MNTRALNFKRETVQQLKLHTDSHTVVVGNFSTPLLSVDRAFKQKLNRVTATEHYTQTL